MCRRRQMVRIDKPVHLLSLAPHPQWIHCKEWPSVGVVPRKLSWFHLRRNPGFFSQKTVPPDSLSNDTNASGSITHPHRG